MTREARPVALALLGVLWASLPMLGAAALGVGMYALTDGLSAWGRVLYAIPSAALGFVLTAQPTGPVISNIWGRLLSHLKTVRKDKANG